MKVGLLAPFVSPIATPEYIAEYGEVAESCGFHSLWLAEHVVLFDEKESRYPYSQDGEMPTSGENGFVETFTALSFLACVTNHIRLGTGICVVPQRNPVYTAKESAAIDWLSHGRLDFGVGVGWQQEEFEAVGFPFARRGARCRSFVEVIKHLWCDRICEYQDEFYSLPACRMDPKPVQSPHPPVYFGGESRAALQRVAEQGQGWYGLNCAPEDLPPLIAQLEAFLSEQGRSLSEVEVAVSPYLKACDRDKLARYAECGVDQLIVAGIALDRESIRSTLEGLAEELVRGAADL